MSHAFSIHEFLNRKSQIYNTLPTFLSTIFQTQNYGSNYQEENICMSKNLSCSLHEIYDPSENCFISVGFWTSYNRFCNLSFRNPITKSTRRRQVQSTEIRRKPIIMYVRSVPTITNILIITSFMYKTKPTGFENVRLLLKRTIFSYTYSARKGSTKKCYLQKTYIVSLSKFNSLYNRSNDNDSVMNIEPVFFSFQN